MAIMAIMAMYKGSSYIIEMFIARIRGFTAWSQYLKLNTIGNSRKVFPGDTEKGKGW